VGSHDTPAVTGVRPSQVTEEQNIILFHHNPIFFQPKAAESARDSNSSAIDIPNARGHRFSSSSSEKRGHFFQRITVTMQCFNAIRPIQFTNFQNTTSTRFKMMD